VTAVFGDALQAYLTKKVESMEELFMQQLEVFVNIIADSQSQYGRVGDDEYAGELTGGTTSDPQEEVFSQIVALEKVMMVMMMNDDDDDDQ